MEETDVITSAAGQSDVTMSTATEFLMTEPDNWLEFLAPMGLQECSDIFRKYRTQFDLDQNDYLCFCHGAQIFCKQKKYSMMDPELFQRFKRARPYAAPSFPTPEKSKPYIAIGVVVGTVGILGECILHSVTERG